ncbi:MAG: hypothetical protein VX000_08680, partial [Myxococcota bacterium]|nr:hypothetical protein [Myxococcota bacterium]
IADQKQDPARRPLGEGRAPVESLDVANHFIVEARKRLAHREMVAATVPPRLEQPIRWTLLLFALLGAAVVGFAGVIALGRDRVHRAERAAAGAEEALTAELIQQMDRASAVTALAGAASGSVEQRVDEATSSADVPEQLVAVQVLEEEMQRVLQDMPTPLMSERQQIQTSLAQQVRDSRRRIAIAARIWRDANSDWTAACNRGPGRLAVLVGAARPPPGPRRSVPRP